MENNPALIGFYEYKNGEWFMKGRILITYVSRTGSTREIAEFISDRLRELDQEVLLLPMSEVGDLSEYDAVVVGSPINGSAWLPEAMAFVRKNQAPLAAKPFATFTGCSTLAMREGEKYLEAIRGWLAPVRALVHPVSEGIFAGTLHPSELKGKGSLGMKLAVTVGVFPRGDRRDWAAIRAWTETLPTALGL